MNDRPFDAASHMAAVIKAKHGRVRQPLPPVTDIVDIGHVRSSLAAPKLYQDDAPLEGRGLFNALLARMPHDVQSSFTHDQIRALHTATQQLRWGQHSLDMRLSLPVLGRRMYLVLIGGSERRSPERLIQEGRMAPPGDGVLRLVGIVALVSVVVTLFNVGWHL